MEQTNRISKGLAWKLLERFGVQGMQFVLQLLLARLLDPAHYGVLSLMVVFTTLATVFIQTGFNTALVQNKEVTEEDYSSVLWVSLGIATVMYAALFLGAPLIAQFYAMPTIVAPLRVLALMLFPGAVNSIQIAKVSREMDFRNIFFSNVGAIILSGAVGLFLAYRGAGLWALVGYNVLNVAAACAIMWFTVRWRPRFVCRLSRIKTLFSFGWKLLVSNLIDVLYQDVRSLVIGKKYDSGTLGYYNRGKQFPQFIINAVNGAVQSVMLPAMAAQQEKKETVRNMMRRSVTASAYIVFPVMAGLAAVAEPLVRLLLTEKWVPCVPYLQIYCMSLALYPVHSCNLQAINAMGRSDIFLKLEILKKGVGLASLVVAVFCFESPIAIAMTGVFTTCISAFINAYPNKKLIGYSYRAQIKDLAPTFVMSCAVFAVVYALSFLAWPAWLLLLVQVPCGVGVYVLLSRLFRVECFTYFWAMVKKILKKSGGRV